MFFERERETTWDNCKFNYYLGFEVRFKSIYT